MASRKQLKSVAHNLAQFCASRNFDHNGYWAIGHLYSYANKTNKDKLVLDLLKSRLLQQKTIKFSDTFLQVLEILNHETSANNISQQWINKATIEFEFNTSYSNEKHLLSPLKGDPFTCRATIITDKKNTYTQEVYCNVWPHDPRIEQKRADT